MSHAQLRHSIQDRRRNHLPCTSLRNWQRCDEDMVQPRNKYEWTKKIWQNLEYKPCGYKQSETGCASHTRLKSRISSAPMRCGTEDLVQNTHQDRVFSQSQHGTWYIRQSYRIHRKLCHQELLAGRGLESQRGVVMTVVARLCQSWKSVRITSSVHWRESICVVHVNFVPRDTGISRNWFANREHPTQLR